jgi:hypothetical protein
MSKVTEIKHPDKVELLKKARCVSGKPLLHGKPTDFKISEQIDILLNAIPRNEDEIHAEIDRIYAKLDFSWSEKEAEEFIRKEMNKFVGLDNGPLDNEFWRNFGSAPFYQKYENEKKNGSIGMDVIFGKQFENCYSYCYEIPGKINSLLESFKDKKKRTTEKEKENVVSTFRDLADLEENLTVKKIPAEAKIYYNDKSKPFKERVKVFEKYGDTDSSIHEPAHPYLKKIFQIHLEEGYVERHEMINCLDVIDFWISQLKDRRSKICYKNNKYHPEIKSKKRNYTPSVEAIERLKRYYSEIVIEEGMASFELDW